MSDKKVIDEILIAQSGCIYLEDGDELCRLRGPAWSSDRNEARAKLMAAAPEMARLILSAEFPAGYCESCGKPGFHLEDCEWLRVMKKAWIDYA